MKKLAVVGRHPHTKLDAPYDDESYDIWAFNDSGRQFKRITALFQMHPRYVIEHVNGHLEWLRNNTTIPVYMREYRDDIPMCVVYPFDEVFALTKHILYKEEQLRFFTSTVPVSIALAVLQNRPSIDFYGIETANNTEYRKQRACYAFWVGFAGGRGIDINLHCGVRIFKKDLYFWPSPAECERRNIKLTSEELHDQTEKGATATEI
jgi:hypothetical protein